jgi:cytochrome P450
VHFLPGQRTWLLIGYDDVQHALRDARVFSSDIAELHRVDHVLLGSDPPAHDDARKALAHLFSPDVVARRREQSERRAMELLEPLKRGRELDVVLDFALPLFVAEAAALLRVDASHTIPFAELLVTEEGDLPLLFAHMEDVAAALSVDGALFSELLRDLGDEAAAKSVLRLLWISTMTPRHSVAQAVLLLLRQPDIRRAVTADPALLPAFVEESFRLRPPAHRVPRLATRDVVVGGQTIAAGDRVELCIAAANRDPARFHDPCALRLDRSSNPHLSFGGGIHRCIGASLARSLVGAALRALLQVAPEFRAAQPLFTVQPTRGSSSLHGIDQLVIAS